MLWGVFLDDDSEDEEDDKTIWYILSIFQIFVLNYIVSVCLGMWMQRPEIQEEDLSSLRDEDTVGCKLPDLSMENWSLVFYNNLGS